MELHVSAGNDAHAFWKLPSAQKSECADRGGEWVSISSNKTKTGILQSRGRGAVLYPSSVAPQGDQSALASGESRILLEGDTDTSNYSSPSR